MRDLSRFKILIRSSRFKQKASKMKVLESIDKKETFASYVNFLGI
jgi:hypothetical protein